MKKLFSVFLAGVLLACMLSVVPVSVSAESWGDFTYTVSGGEATITGYTGNGGNVIIPSEVRGTPVTAIGYMAFRGDDTLTSVTIPDTVKKIDSFAFDCCFNLKSVDLGNGVTWILYKAFQSCVSLTGIEIPDSVESLGGHTFEFCTGLESVTLGSGIEEVGYNDFAGCSNLKKVRLKNGIKMLGDEMFEGCESLESIEIPDSVREIWSYAFYGCESLESIVIPNSVTEMGNGVFAYCDRLAEIHCLFAERPPHWNENWIGDGCYAEVYWEPVDTPIPGDLGGDGVIDATDYMLLKRYVLGSYRLTTAQEAVADVNRDGTINAVDYMLVKRHVLGTYKIA